MGLIGHGGMGAVYSAEHTLLGRPAAIKLLLPELSRNREMVTRFFNEARAAAAIDHPSIVEIYDFGWHDDGSAYLVMEQLRGESLASRLARGRMTAAGVVTIARQIASALVAAHSKAIVHRDLKPENIFLVPDTEVVGGERIKLLDFGIAKLCAETEARTTSPGQILGTPTYMAPEQCRGAAVDHRADLYSLGCILFEACTGRPPFVGEGMGDLLAAHIHVPPPKVSSLATDAPPELVAVIDQLLVKDRGRRTQCADAVALEMDAIAGASTPIFALGSGPRAQVPSQPSRTLPSSHEATGAQPLATRRRYRRLLGHVLTAAAAFAIAAIGIRILRSEPGVRPSSAAVSAAAPVTTSLVQSALPAPTTAALVAKPSTETATLDPASTLPSEARVSGLVEQPLLTAVAAPRTVHPPRQSPSAPLLPPPQAPPEPPGVSTPVEETPAPASLTGASVVQRYIEVGGQLRTLQEEHGRQAAAKLWEAFRYIRINDALFDPQKREAIDTRLRRIQDEIAERSR